MPASYGGNDVVTPSRADPIGARDVGHSTPRRPSTSGTTAPYRSPPARGDRRRRRVPLRIRIGDTSGIRISPGGRSGARRSAVPIHGHQRLQRQLRPMRPAAPASPSTVERMISPSRSRIAFLSPVARSSRRHRESGGRHRLAVGPAGFDPCRRRGRSASSTTPGSTSPTSSARSTATSASTVRRRTRSVPSTSTICSSISRRPEESPEQGSLRRPPSPLSSGRGSSDDGSDPCGSGSTSRSIS